MCFHVSINLPSDVEELVRREVADLDGAARESLLLDLFRRGVLTHYELSRGLGIDRFETDALLKKRGIFEGSPTMEDLEADRRAIDYYFQQRGQ
jgi:hypothetical protein